LTWLESVTSGNDLAAKPATIHPVDDSAFPIAFAKATMDIPSRGEQEKPKPKNRTGKLKNRAEKPINRFDFSKKFDLVNRIEKFCSVGFNFGSPT